ncbi:hypothetical protein STAS_26415 [Striga asiatica]|uniref:Uncharacterized protein n=1 Tax=Striga asiatica TaxID=4170 RepID=A0A5A7QW42_STRAF|nr:hypothetical protein STAS_26415 [Striga asiatica]
MNGEREDELVWCYFHPRELVIGICASCLKERLLVLAASKQKHYHQVHTSRRATPKIFALSGLINPLDVMQHKSVDHVCDESGSSTSHEESFISIRFEDNGVASWDKGKVSKTQNDNNNQINRRLENDHNTPDKANKTKSVVEHAKTRATLRWRKRIGHLLHLIRWRRSASKGNGSSHVGKKLEGAKVKHGWIRILTKRRTKE